MSKRKAVLFLGSGATAGSGLTNGGCKLPTDGEFFNSPLVCGRLQGGGYPAIRLMRKQTLQERSLYKTWNDLFVYRGLARAGVIREGAEVIDEFNRLANHAWPAAQGCRAEHYRHQFQIMGSELREYYFAELAVWDLRVLVKDVYEIQDVTHSAHKAFLKCLGGRADVSAVINLNYDTTFDQALTGKFYHPGDSTSAEGKLWPLIRPHGSLRWTSRSEWSIPEARWLRWTESWDNTALWRWGYQRSPSVPDRLEFHQALIVTPAMTKEEVVGNSSMPGLGSDILRQQWIAVERALQQSDCWIFVGLSLASGDDHLVFLLRRALAGRPVAVHCSCYGNQHACVNFECLLERSVCCHCIRENQPVTDFLCRGSSACALRQ